MNTLGENGLIVALYFEGENISPVVVREREWRDEAVKKVTFWAGPEFGDERTARRNLIEISCRALRVGSRGEWVCVDEKIVDEAILEAFEKVAEDVISGMANEDAAMTWSAQNDNDVDEYGDVWVKAEFGDAVGVNGDLVQNDPDPPEGWEETDRGGRVPSDEVYVSVDSATRAIADKISKDLGRVIPDGVVRKIIEDKDWLYREEIAWSASGDTEIWAPPERIRARILRQQQREVERRRAALDPHFWAPELPERKKKRGRSS